MIKAFLLSISILLFTSGCIEVPEFSKLYQQPKAQPVYTSNKDVLMFILDGSGSMGEVDGSGNIKMRAAKSMLKDIANKIDSKKTNVGLIGFSNGCYSSRLLIAPTNNDLSKVVTVSQAIQAHGKTPLAASIRKAGEVLKHIDKKVNIIIISDGIETCGGDPVAEARRLKNYGIDSKIYVIGYSVDRRTKSQLENLAKAGGGVYYSAKDSASLDHIITNITDELDIKSDEWKNNTYNFKINFDSSSSKLKKKYDEQIKKLANYLINTNTSAELQGHTDSVGSKKANQILSQKRAQAVVDKLISFHVPKSHVYAVGFGELAPIADNKTKEGRYQNRRVEAHIIKNGLMDISHINQANSNNMMNVKDATMNSFIGYYKALDPHRGYNQYHIWLELYANNQGVYGEYKNNRNVTKPKDNKLAWNFNRKKKTITLDYSDNGKKPGWAEFEGKLSGNTNRFTLSGHWGNGSAGKIIVKRISKAELSCMQKSGEYQNGKCISR